jgi:hypothetical protein
MRETTQDRFHPANWFADTCAGNTRGVERYRPMKSSLSPRIRA